MADDKRKIGAPDRGRVSSTERYEVDYLAKKFELPAPPEPVNAFETAGGWIY